MTEQTARPNKPFESWFSDETREHYRAARKEIREGMKTLLPPGYVEHHEKAHKEMLLAWRAMIDDAIKHMDEHGEKDK
jgi:hypothetical protein